MTWYQVLCLLACGAVGGVTIVVAELRCVRRYEEARQQLMAGPPAPMPSDMSDAEIWRALAIDYPTKPWSPR